MRPRVTRLPVIFALSALTACASGGGGGAVVPGGATGNGGVASNGGNSNSGGNTGTGGSTQPPASGGGSSSGGTGSGGVSQGVGENGGSNTPPPAASPSSPVQVTTTAEPSSLATWNVAGTGTGNTIGAPARGTTGANTAVNPTACCTPAPGTKFPLLQSTMKATSSGIAPDAATNSGGATLTAVDASAGKYQLTIPSLDIDYQFEAPSSLSPLLKYGNYVLTPSSGDVVRFISEDFYYVQFGAWAVRNGGTGALKSFAFYVTGYETAAMPTTGTATYEPSVGSVTLGVVTVPSGDGFASAALSGLGRLEANFATGAVSGTFKNMNAWDGTTATPWNDVSVNSTIAAGMSTFSGTTAVTSAPVAPFALKSNATGHVDGKFYGPAASEVGAIWSLSDGVGSAVGLFAGSTIPSGSTGVEAVAGGLPP